MPAVVIAGPQVNHTDAIQFLPHFGPLIPRWTSFLSLPLLLTRKGEYLRASLIVLQLFDRRGKLGFLFFEVLLSRGFEV